MNESRSKVETRYRLVVVDDHALFRRGLIGLLGDMTEFEVVGEASDGEEALGDDRPHPSRHRPPGREHAAHGRHLPGTDPAASRRIRCASSC